MVPNFRYTAQAAEAGDHLVVRPTGIEGAMRIFVNIGGVEVTVSEVSFTVPKNVRLGRRLSCSFNGCYAVIAAGAAAHQDKVFYFLGFIIKVNANAP
jgi:hypothetical protein